MLTEISRAVEANLQQSQDAAGAESNSTAANRGAASASTAYNPHAAGATVATGLPPPVAAAPTLQAGFSVPYVPRGTRTAGHAWTDLTADAFRVRCGPDYNKNGKKAPSGPALGTVVAVDCLRSSGKIFNLLALNHIALPEPTPGWNEAYPEFLVINQQLPVEFHNSLFTSETTDGETLHLIVYVRLRPNLAPGYHSDQEPQDAEQLLKRFLLLADQDPDIAHCFKEIGMINNLDELASQMPRSLTSLFRKFNGKPVLTRPEHFFHRDPKGRYFAIDLDSHRYKFMTRSAMHKGLQFVERTQLGYGYVVEARKEPELPEVMLCCCEILKLQRERAVWFPPAARADEQESKQKLISDRD